MRAFVAIELDDPIRRRLAGAQQRLLGAGSGVKWVRPENVHLTLKFLGEAADDAIGAIVRALGEAAGGVEPFAARVIGLGAFPPRGVPRVVWAGIIEPTGSLLALQQRVERALEPLGFPPETRAFAAHATLGRVKKPHGARRLQQAVGDLADEDFGRQRVAAVALFRSDLSPAGPTYTALARVPLGKGGE